MVKNNKTATIIERSVFGGDYSFKIKLVPGYPYDPKTKGMPHQIVWLVFSTIQDKVTFIAKNALILCSNNKQAPDLSYIHVIHKLKNSLPSDDVNVIKPFFKSLGYKLQDELEMKREKLVTSAMAKLTEEEIDAINYRKIKNIIRENTDEDDDI